MGNFVKSVSTGVQDIAAHPTDVGKHWDDFSNAWSAEGQDMGVSGAPSADMGAAGTGGAGVMMPTTMGQANTQYGNVQQGLQQQQNFLNAIQAQNGLANQSSVYNQMQGVANGTGPNPAQAQLAQATGANTANQAALMASQRGAGANSGMLARQAAMVGAGNQQQAAGQAATLQAQQSLNALGQMGGLATNQANQQANATNAYTNASLGSQGNVLGGIAAQNNANVGLTTNANTNRTSLANTNAAQQGNMFGNVLGAVGSVFAMAEGGEVNQGTTQLQQSQGPANGGPSSSIGKFFAGDSAPIAAQAGVSTQPAEKKGLLSGLFAKGGQVPALVSPGEKVLTPKDVSKVSKGASPMAIGKEVPGKAKVGGAKNDYANDTVPASLPAGGIVLPRSVTQAKDAPEKARAFVAAILKKQAHKKGK